MKLSDLDKRTPITLSEGSGFLNLLTETGGVGRVVRGVNTTPDVKPGEIKRQSSKFGFETSPDGVPPLLSTNGMIKKKMGTTKRSHRQ